MKQDAFFQTIIHHIGGEGNVARKTFLTESTCMSL